MVATKARSTVALVHGERRIPLAGGDQVSLAAGLAIEGQPLDVGLEAVLADPRDRHAVRPAVGLGAVGPDPDVLLADVKVAVVGVGDAPLDLRPDLQDADPLGVDGAVVLGRRSGTARPGRPCSRRTRNRPRRAGSIDARAVGLAAVEGGNVGHGADGARRRASGSIVQTATPGSRHCGRRPRPDRRSARRAGTRRSCRRCSAASPRRRPGGGAVEVEDVQSALLVGPQDEAPGRVGRVDPDGRVVGRVPLPATVSVSTTAEGVRITGSSTAACPGRAEAASASNAARPAADRRRWAEVFMGASRSAGLKRRRPR